jgi:secreted PhoX family phosphatase
MIKNSYWNRRRFLQSGSKSFIGFFLGVSQFSSAQIKQANAQSTPLFNDYGDLLHLQEPDENGIRLPAGFKSRLIAQSDQPVIAGSSFLWHHAPDGGACYPTEDNGWIYVSNSEIDESAGGVGAIRFNAGGEIVDAYSILSGTTMNCAGGKTPWNTWLSCEETERGLVYECDPFGRRTALPKLALGRFEHEAVAVDPLNQILYLTEDVEDGGWYRFIPDRALPDLSSGTLQIAQIIKADNLQRVIWHTVPDPEALNEQTRYQIESSSPFNGGEGIAWSDGKIYFTTKGDNRVWIYDTASSLIDVLYDAAVADDPILQGVDNVTITASGDVLVAEDGGDMQLVLLTFNGRPIPVLQITGQDESEICGPAFDPSFQRLYFSSQTGPSNEDNDGRIYEISRIS